MSKGNTHIPTLGRVIVWEVSEGGRGIGDGGRWVHEGEMERDGGRWVHEGEMERDGGVVGDGRWRRNGERGRWKGLGISKSLISF